MSDREKLDFEAIEGWALAHGFENSDDNVLSAPYGEGRVQIEFLGRNIRVSLAAHGKEQRLITAHPSRLRIDENDMLHGAGLFSRFYTNYREDYRERGEQALMPVWFGVKVQAMIAEHVASENARTV
jgi:hypothetical protein